MTAAHPVCSYSKGKAYYNDLLHADTTNKPPSNKSVHKPLLGIAANGGMKSPDLSTGPSMKPSSTSYMDRQEQAVSEKEMNDGRTVQNGGHKTLSHLLAAAQAGAMVRRCILT